MQRIPKTCHSSLRSRPRLVPIQSQISSRLGPPSVIGWTEAKSGAEYLDPQTSENVTGFIPTDQTSLGPLAGLNIGALGGALLNPGSLAGPSMILPPSGQNAFGGIPRMSSRQQSGRATSDSDSQMHSGPSGQNGNNGSKKSGGSLTKADQRRQRR